MSVLQAVLLGVFILNPILSAANSSKKLQLVTTTSDIAAIAGEIGKEKLEVINLVPGDDVPGTF